MGPLLILLFKSFLRGFLTQLPAFSSRVNPFSLVYNYIYICAHTRGRSIAIPFSFILPTFSSHIAIHSVRLVSHFIALSKVTCGALSRKVIHVEVYSPRVRVYILLWSRGVWSAAAMFEIGVNVQKAISWQVLPVEKHKRCRILYHTAVL